MEASQAKSIPDWIPESVKNMAIAIEIGKDVDRIHLTDHRMKVVWRELQKRGKKLDADKFAKIDKFQRMKTWGVSDFGVSLQDQACAAFYSCVVITLGIFNPAVRQKYLLEYVKKQRSMAEECRLAVETIGPPPPNQEEAKALLISAAFFDHRASFVEQTNPGSPYLLPRSTRAVGVEDDTTRGRVRALAVGTHAIFRTYLYGTLATTAGVALNMNISPKTVENWCSDLEGSSLLERIMPNRIVSAKFHTARTTTTAIKAVKRRITARLITSSASGV